MLVVDLGKWMNKILIDWGIDPKVADRFDETIIALLMIAIAIGLNYLCQAILIGGMKQYTRRKPHLWNTLLMLWISCSFLCALCCKSFFIASDPAMVL